MDESEFANIAANPIEQIIKLAAPVSARYIRFSAISLLAGQRLSIAEIGVLSN